MSSYKTAKTSYVGKLNMIYNSQCIDWSSNVKLIKFIQEGLTYRNLSKNYVMRDLSLWIL